MVRNTENERAEAGKAAKKGGFAGCCYEWLEAVIFAFIVVVLLFTFVFRDITVIGQSMVPNLQNGDKILVSCLYQNSKPGDIVVVDARATRLNLVLVKRVIATEGQVVNIDFSTGDVFVDGEKLDESAYIENNITTQQYDVAFPQTVPPGHVFLMGDNRYVSEDSRNSMVGMVDTRYLMGRVLAVHFPFSSFKWF